MSNNTRTPALLITGASRGLGQALAIEAAKAGFSLILLARKTQNLFETADLITDAGKPAPLLYGQPLDTLTIEQAHAIIHGIVQDVGHLDGIIHNAALCSRLAPLDHYPAPLMTQVFHTNVFAPFYLTQAALPIFHQNDKGGLIVGIGDKAMSAAPPHWGAYGASKVAMAHLIDMWSQEQKNDNHVTFQYHNLPAMKTHLRLSTHPGAEIDTLANVNIIAQSLLKSILKTKKFSNQVASI